MNTLKCMFHGFYESKSYPDRAVAQLCLCSNTVKLIWTMSVQSGEGASVVSELSHLLYCPNVTIGFPI